MLLNAALQRIADTKDQGFGMLDQLSSVPGVITVIVLDAYDSRSCALAFINTTILCGFRADIVRSMDHSRLVAQQAKVHELAGALKDSKLHQLISIHSSDK